LPAIQTADEVLDEWGAVTASPPIISIPADEYEFKIEKTSQQYYESAKEEVNAGILQHTKTVFSFLLAASAQADSTTKALYESQLSSYKDAVAKAEAGENLTEEEKLAAKEAKQSIIDSLATAAKDNFTKCAAIADKEGESVTGEISAADAIAINNAAVERRRACLNDYQAELSELSAVSEIPDFPTLQEGNVPALNRQITTPFNAKAELNSEPFSLGTSGLSQNITLPDYNALPQAATNKFLADMLKAISSNEDKNAYFGVSMISVNPGWRTREGYHAVINLNPTVLLDRASKTTVRKYIQNPNVADEFKKLIEANYFDACEEDIDIKREVKQLYLVQNEICKEKYAQIVKDATDKFSIQNFDDLLQVRYEINTTAISPVTYAQTQELQNRQISQINLSLMLAATLQSAGMKESAEAFADFSKQRKREFSSRSADNNVSVFSTGKLVGLEIQPEFLAATWNDSDPSMQLQQQTFPILLRFDTIGEKEFEELTIAKNCDGIASTDDFCLLEPFINVVPTTRWKSSERSPWLLNSKEQLTTEDQFNLKKALDAECDSNKTEQFIVHKCEELTSKLFGDIQYSRLPDRLIDKPSPKPVEFSHVFPSSVELKRDEESKLKPLVQDVILLGKNFVSLGFKDDVEIKDKITSVFEGVEIQSAMINGNILKITTQITDAKGPIIFVIDRGKSAISTAMNKGAIATLKAEAPKKAKDNEKAETVIKVTVGDNQSVAVTLPNGVDDLPEHVREVLMSYYEKPSNIVVPSIGSHNSEN
tara:strand:+ start:486 stop:2792 length:2307 start_codon:yes stop_codon:yes gene_type:complete